MLCQSSMLLQALGKKKWFEQYMKAESDIIVGLMKLPEESDLTQEVKDTLAKFICSVYCPQGIYNYKYL